MDTITNLLSITLGAILVNNFIFSQFLGCCPFLGVSKKVDTAVGMGIAVTFVMGLASAVCYVVDEFVLGRFGLDYMQTVAFILVIAALVQFIEMFLQKAMPSLYTALGIYLPLITTNCAVLGVVLLIMCVIREFLGAGTILGGLLEIGENGLVFGLGTAKGISILPEQFPMGMLTLPVGGFLILACLIAAMQWALSKSKDKEESK